VGVKSNEITVLPELSAMLHLKGSVATIDNMGTQRAIAKQIIYQGGDYILSAKGNQGRLHDETRGQLAFALRQLDAVRHDAEERWRFARTMDSGHDRRERRETL
jgi:predicted transposase YbfD/YdcC